MQRAGHSRRQSLKELQFYADNAALQELSADKLGYAASVRELVFGTTKDRMLVIEGTKMSKAMTIFVRGGNKVTVFITRFSVCSAMCHGLLAEIELEPDEVCTNAAAYLSNAVAASSLLGFRMAPTQQGNGRFLCCCAHDEPACRSTDDPGGDEAEPARRPVRGAQPGARQQRRLRRRRSGDLLLACRGSRR